MAEDGYRRFDLDDDVVMEAVRMGLMQEAPDEPGVFELTERGRTWLNALLDEKLEGHRARFEQGLGAGYDDLGVAAIEAETDQAYPLKDEPGGVIPKCPQCRRLLHGYRGPLCRYCAGAAE